MEGFALVAVGVKDAVRRRKYLPRLSRRLLDTFLIDFPFFFNNNKVDGTWKDFHAKHEFQEISRCSSMHSCG